jgi:hypothetical protein
MTKQLLWWRGILMGFAIFLTMLPLSFRFDNGPDHVEVPARDAPSGKGSRLAFRVFHDQPAVLSLPQLQGAEVELAVARQFAWWSLRFDTSRRTSRTRPKGSRSPPARLAPVRLANGDIVLPQPCVIDPCSEAR